MSQTPEGLFTTLHKKFPTAQKHEQGWKGALNVKIPAENLLPICRTLKEELDFNYLHFVTAVDWKGPVDPKGYITDPNPNPFLPEGATPQTMPSPPTPGFPYRNVIEMIYCLMRVPEGQKIILRVELPRNNLEVSSLYELWKTADWQEREVFDLMGVEFTGHPNLKKILTPEFIKGYPLRKDYVHEKDQYD